MDLIGPELSELFALEFAKIAESDFVYTLVYTLASTNVDQLVPNMQGFHYIMKQQSHFGKQQIRLGVKGTA